jgi:hypothetical protein
MGGATMTSAISFSTAALLAPPSPSRNLMLTAAALSFTFFPWTLIAMMPVNNELVTMDKGQIFSAGTSEEKYDLEKRALECLDKWQELHKVRIALGAGAWLVGLAAFFVTV